MEHAVAGSFGRPIVCPVLIGRDAAVAALHRLIDGGEADRCRMALVAGEAGLGKSRLAAEAKGYAAAHGFVVLEGACFPQDRTCPYAMLLDLLRGRFAGHEAETVTAAIGPFARELFPLLPDLIPRPAEPLPALEPEQERRQLFAALAHSLVGGSADQPVLVVVEDLHWCDDGSLDFLLYLARHAAGRPRLILGTYRAEDADPRLRHWLAELDREHLAHELALAPLARAIIEDLASNVPDEGLRDEFLRTATARLPRPYRLSPRRVAAARHGGLTAREREVAQLIAQGSTNREIADVLVLGERTVETHVSHVLAKLGLDSRREIARWAADKGLSDDAP